MVSEASKSDRPGSTVNRELLEHLSMFMTMMESQYPENKPRCISCRKIGERHHDSCEYAQLRKWAGRPVRF